MNLNLHLKLSHVALGFISLFLVSCSSYEPTLPEAKPILQTPSEPTPQEPPEDSLQPLRPQERKLALLLPLSGEHASIGQALLNASEMALFDAGDSSLKILPRDTKGTLESAKVAAESALSEKVDLIIGPLFAKEASAIKPFVHAKHVPMVSFSTDQGIADSDTFVMGFLPSRQIEAILEAAQAHGYHNIAALLPNNEYGQLVKKTLDELQQTQSLQLVSVQFYHKDGTSATSLERAVEGLKGQKFDALLIPEGGETLKKIALLLPAQGIETSHIKLLGSGQWDSPDIAFIPALTGAWFPSPDPHERTSFEQRYQRLYHTTPPRIATIAYDAVAMAAALASQGYSHNSLTLSQGFKGLDGLFRFKSDGRVERSLAILEVAPSGFKVVSPSLHSFTQR